VKLPQIFSIVHFRSETDHTNFLNAQNEAIGVGLATTAATFLPVFLTRLGASNQAVGLLTSMPAITGLLLSIPLGSYLHHRRNVVPWYSISRLLSILPFALTGLIAFFVQQKYLVVAVLAIWAIVTLPQTIVGILFNVVMNDVAGSTRRFELMSRRWIVLGISTSLSLVLVGQALGVLDFPFNYQIVFIVLSLGGVMSYLTSNRIHLPENQPLPDPPAISLREAVRNYLQLIRSEPPFVSFNAKRFVYLTGIALTTPLFPLYYVRVADASDAWIGIFNTAQTVILIVGYFFWIRQSRHGGNRRLLLWSTLGLAIYPALVAVTHNDVPVLPPNRPALARREAIQRSQYTHPPHAQGGWMTGQRLTSAARQ
jgi:MFS family permease